MNVLILGWADLQKGSLEGGGYNLVALEHAKALIDSGDNVFYIRSGLDFSLLSVLSIKNREFIKSTGSFSGIKTFSFYNSKNYAPGIFNINNQDNFFSDVDQNRIIADFINKDSIDKVYIHSHEGYNIGLIPYLKSCCTVKISIFCHDHFFLCPQVNLLYQDREICIDYKNGERCKNCKPVGFAVNYKKNRWVEDSVVSWVLKLKSRLNKTPTSENVPIKTFDNIDFFNNLGVLDDRREAVVNALNYADRVFSPSNFIIEGLLKIGVLGEKLTRVKLGLPHLDKLKVLSSFTPSDKVRFCYRGTERNLKGAFILFEAIKLLPVSIFDLVCFDIYGIDKSYLETFNLPSGVEVNMFGTYNIDDIYNQRDYDIGILTHLWFENSPIVMLEHISLGKPILSPKLGGVVDYITDRSNGLFYKAGDPSSLGSLINDIILKRVKLPIVNREDINSLSDFIKDLY